MFADDQPKIQQYAWESPEHMADTLLFVRLTIRRHLYLVPKMMREVKAYGIVAIPDRASQLCYTYIRKEAAYIAEAHWDNNELFRHILRMPGFGIPKAGFALQLLLGIGGCLDVHNLSRFGLKASAFRIDAPWHTVERRIHLYQTICNGIGDSEYFWDSWCQYVATSQPLRYNGADEVSKLHVEAIIGSS